MAVANPFIVVGLGISALAGLAAFLITYEEWSHHYPTTREPLRYAMEAAIVAFAVFMLLTLLSVYFIGLIVDQQMA